MTVSAAVVTLMAWGAAVTELKTHMGADFILAVGAQLKVGLAATPERAGVFLSFLFRLLILPLTVFALAMLEREFPHRCFSWLSPIGDLTYSIYLVHVPLQLTLMTATGDEYRLWVGSDDLAFVIFVVLLLPLATASYRFVEMPAQRLLRALGSPAKADPVI